jgi:putative superfamily III holin-X
VALRAPAPSEDESIPALVQRVGIDVRRIVRTEVRLVQLRARAALDVVRAAGIGLVAAIVLGMAGLGIVLAGAVIVLGTVIPMWIAAFAIGGGLLLLAGVLVLIEVRVLTHGVNEALAPVDDVAQEQTYGR